MGLEKSCIFLDNTGFNLHVNRSRDSSKESKPAKSIVPASQGTSIVVLGAVSALGLIDISLRKPITVAISKTRKAIGTIATATVRNGTVTKHFLGYLQGVIDSLDKNNLKCHHIVIGKAAIHKPITVIFTFFEPN